MPIMPFLNGEPFDLEGQRVIRVAFEMVRIALRTGDCDDYVMALAKAGERNPDILCEQVLKVVRTSFHHQSEAQPPNGTLTAATSPDTPSSTPGIQSVSAGAFLACQSRSPDETAPVHVAAGERPILIHTFRPSVT
jgi:hypothetical protein